MGTDLAHAVRPDRSEQEKQDENGQGGNYRGKSKATPEEGVALGPDWAHAGAALSWIWQYECLLAPAEAVYSAWISETALGY